MQIKQAFVLAGGKGERLRPLTLETPKPLVKVKGKPILEYSIELLKKHGVTEVILSVGYMHEKIIDYFGDGQKFGVSIVYAIEEEPLGTGGALKQAEELLSEKFFMLNGDNIADYDLNELTKTHEKNNALATLTLSEVEDVSSFGVAKLDGEKIIEFVEKPKKENAPSNWVNAGAYAIEKKALEFLPEGFNLIEKTMFPALAKQGKLFSYKHKGKWFTTDTFERIKKAESGLN
ncbi:MAG: nucleotidyltransferase family protein [archaeon]|nr:nucleotidyltransferase family protein [archaeon]